MNALGFALLRAIAVAGAIVITACSNLQLTTEGAGEPTACNGRPDWCLVARSELDAHRPAYVFLDGEERGLVLPGTDSTLRIPVTSGARPLVNFCGYFDAGAKKEWRCSTPTNVAFVKGDQMLVIYPLK